MSFTGSFNLPSSNYSQGIQLPSVYPKSNTLQSTGGLSAQGWDTLTKMGSGQQGNWQRLISQTSQQFGVNASQAAQMLDPYYQGRNEYTADVPGTQRSGSYSPRKGRSTSPSSSRYSQQGYGSYQGYRSLPSTGSYGSSQMLSPQRLPTLPSVGSYGSSQGYRSLPSTGSYGSLPSAGSYGSLPSAGSYGSLPSTGSYGSTQMSSPQRLPTLPSVGVYNGSRNGSRTGNQGSYYNGNRGSYYGGNQGGYNGNQGGYSGNHGGYNGNQGGYSGNHGGYVGGYDGNQGGRGSNKNEGPSFSMDDATTILALQAGGSPTKANGSPRKI